MDASKYKKTRNYLRSIGYTTGQANTIMMRYGQFLNIEFVPNPLKNYQNERSVYLHIIGLKIQNDWQVFVDFYKTIKNQYTQKIIYRKLTNS